MILTYKRKLKIRGTKEDRIRSWVGASRVVYNLALEVKRSTLKGGKRISRYDLMRQLVDLKDVEWIKDVPAQTLQEVVERMDNAFDRFFKKKGGFPKFRSKKDHKSIVIKQVAVDGDHVKIPKIGWVKCFKDRNVEGKVKRATIKIEPKGIFICIQAEVERAPLCLSESQAGIDMGVAHFCTDHTGEHFDTPSLLKEYERKLRIEQRSLSRKKKGSNNRKKQAKRLARLHDKIRDVRRDHLHKISTTIAKEHSRVFVEDLRIDNMTRSAKGTVDNPGINVKQKSGLNRSILDKGWGVFMGMLEYKTSVTYVDPRYTSQVCNECGAVDERNREDQARFVCRSCGHRDNADVNAAKNIKGLGEAIVREREPLGCALGKEPHVL